jgi:hypothetical protein
MALVAAGASVAFLPGGVVRGHEPIVVDHGQRHRQPVIQIALLLDTSNSMDGLIDQARTQLWAIVNEFARCKRDGQSPRLQVALYEYGNDGLPSANGHVRLVQPFTGDLDLVSEKLWGLRTNGGSEFCGTVIGAATRELVWADEKDAYRAIFIAGNEPFTQGEVDYRSAIGMAVGRGVIVNTIHCGDDNAGRSGQWADGARLGEGRYLWIDQNRAAPAVIAPQDEKIRKLSLELNETYVPYGDAGAVGALRQANQDMVATSAPSAAAAGADVQRAVAKANAQYNNAKWDLVDALKDGEVKLEALPAEALPEPMKELSKEERAKYVEGQATKRAELQQQINALNDERGKYVAEKEKEQAKGGAETLNSAVIKVVREQLAERQFEVEK